MAAAFLENPPANGGAPGGDPGVAPPGHGAPPPVPGEAAATNDGNADPVAQPDLEDGKGKGDGVADEPAASKDDSAASKDDPAPSKDPKQPDSKKVEPSKDPIELPEEAVASKDDGTVIGGGGPVVSNEVTAAVTKEPPPVAGGGELPYTGAGTWLLVACAFMLLASGAIFRWSARKQDQPEYVTPGVNVQFAWRQRPDRPA